MGVDAIRRTIGNDLLTIVNVVFVIFDHVLHDRSMYESYLAATAGLDVFTVGVTCPLDILETRERARGDRVLGRARGLSEVVHTFCSYDTMIDTGIMTPDASVKTVLGALLGSRQGS